MPFPLPEKMNTVSSVTTIEASQHLIHIFNTTFLESFHTCLKGGADEPFYSPALSHNQPAIIYFRDDYLSSALHEIAHWVIAGEQRRKLADYGYWYEADGRDAEKQQQFEKVEIKPQAIECLFHLAAGFSFQVSVDNLALPNYDRTPFTKAVERQAYNYCCLSHEPQGKANAQTDYKKSTLPDRAYLFIEALLLYRGLKFSTKHQVINWLQQALVKSDHP